MLNDFYQNIGLPDYFRRYGVVNALRRGAFTANPIHIVKDYELKKVLWQKRAFTSIQKYLRYKDTAPEGLRYAERTVDNPIWIFWDKGMENAPAIVRRCYESVCRYAEQPVILLTADTLSDYLVMPEEIIRKRECGQLPMAVYTDLLRFSLLSRFGGTWLDATVLLTGKIPQTITESDFFAFRNALGLLDNPVLYPAWFLHAQKGNKTITEIRNVDFAYWKRERHVIEYLLPNLIMTAVLHADPRAEKAIPYMDSEYSEHLIRILADDYSEEAAAWMKSLTGIHKLTYKLAAEIDRPQSIYRHILDGEF